MRVAVYYNLHKHLWSVKPLHMTRIAAHASRIVLDDVSFKVSEAGRQRVIREKCKNVHAYVCGELVAFEGSITEAGQGVITPGWSENDDRLSQKALCMGEPVTYRPYEFPYFTRLTGGKWVEAACSSLILFPARKTLALDN